MAKHEKAAGRHHAGGISRRNFLKSAGSALGTTALALAGLPPRMSAAWALPLKPSVRPLHASAPNIVLIVVDQQTFPWHLGNVSLNLPAQRSLEQSAVAFNRHMTNSLMCSPARACIQTGLYSLQNGVESTMGQPLSTGGTQQSLSLSIPTIGDILRAGGYYTGYKGKWHLSDDTSSLEAYGYSDWEGTPPNRTFPEWIGAQDDPGIAEGACQWLVQRQTNPGQPWFLGVNFVNPHDINFPWEVSAAYKGPRGIREDVTLPANWNTDMNMRPAIQRAARTAWKPVVTIGYAQSAFVRGDDAHNFLYYISAYCWLLELVDQQIGLLLNTLQQVDPGLSHTVVIFTADHGDQGGAQGLPWKGPWIYKESINVPLFIKFPGSTQSQVSSLSQHIDLLPTICGFAGVPIPSGLPGMDLRHAIEAGSMPGDRLFFFESDFAVPSTPLAGKIYGTIADTSDGRYKYGCYRYVNGRMETELYLLQESASDEFTNLAGTEPQLENYLQRLLDEWVASTHPGP